ncbi:glycosyltransferase family 4 protein [Algicella marina]|uniref:Glycosyltransferase n=1 Tax=Algicella marina TaxID=2683284 RepID=A0A6P1SX20_9RHOB|nr:glycosyltransferase family 4 protein [Algicella marina]QHQ34075.1 glycosyltransferase [Algicella marina]
MSEFRGPIAYLTGEYPRATDTFIQREVAGLRAQGVEVFTCSIRRTGVEHLVGPEQKAEAASTFYVLAAAKRPLRLLKAHLAAMRRAPARYFAGLRLALKTRPAGLKGFFYQLFYFAEAVLLGEYLHEKGVVHLHNHIAKASCTVAMLMQEVSGIGYSFTMHGPDIFYAPEHWRLDEKIARAKFVACISHFCRSQGMNFSGREHWHRMHIVHCGVIPERYALERRGRGPVRALFIGRLAAVKGVPVLLEALRDVPELELVLIGDGPERRALEAEARELGGRVKFLGYQSQDAVAEALAEADMLVLPSFAEGVPVVLMEAMAAGLPVVTSRVAGIPELVEDKVSGLLVPPGDTAALAEALTTLVEDAGLRREMGEAGRAKVEAEFNLAHEVPWLGRLLAAYVEDGPKPGLRP